MNCCDILKDMKRNNCVYVDLTYFETGYKILLENISERN